MNQTPEQQNPEHGGAQATLKRGVAVIAGLVKRLPNSPGVYRMISDNGDVLYVGKARNLKKRVVSYTRSAGQSARIMRMIQATAAMEFVSTATETDALLLEANLIKRLRPRFNVLLRDDKSFPYILITADHPAPVIRKHRGARKIRGDYFGPFASAGAVDRTINALQKAFLLRTCTDAVFESRTRPCLLYQIKRCAAPCTGEITVDGYTHLVGEAQDFLSGRSQKVRAKIRQDMDSASARLDFEQAAVYRDRLSALSHIQAHQGVNPHGLEAADVFGIHQNGGQSCVQVFFFRTGQNWGNRAYFPRADASLEDGEILAAFVAQFYDNKPPPRQILVSCDFDERALLAQALSEKSGHKVSVSTPRRGPKKSLIDQVDLNAREALERRLAESASQRKLLAGVADIFDLDGPPGRIEVYDNSHIQGTNSVGAMIVAGAEGFAKSQYRKFNIRSPDLTPGDDTAMMREVLTRRFSRLLKEAGPKTQQSERVDNDALQTWPDLLLIDGGRGQLNAVRDVLEELGITDVPFVGIAKGPDRDAGRERFFIPGRDPFRLPPRDPVLYFVQRLRDEAHRFAIGSHRARRKRALIRNPLDDVAGIGPGRKRALLGHFGTAKAVSRAGIEDLRAVPGISDAMAQTIYDYFHEVQA